MLQYSSYGSPNAPVYTLATFDEPQDRFSLAERYEPNNEAPFTRCLEVVEDAVSVIIEHQYIDVDYWSEHSYLNEREFRQRPRTTDRLHFFTVPLKLEDVLHLDDVLPRRDPPRLEEKEDVTRTAQKAEKRIYLGYMVIRPRSTGTVGRTMLRPPPSLEDNVRTAVTETVTIFGQVQRVKAVPFMEQDALLGACAHTVAWMCHYTAVLRSLVPRQITAAIHELAQRTYGTQRPFPAFGMSDLQLVEVLQHLDLPPFMRRISTMGNYLSSKYSTEDVPWNYRKEFVQELSDLLVDEPNGEGVGDEVDEKGIDSGEPDDEDEADGEATAVWFREALTSEVCRYLNSGFPVAIAEGDHIFVVCGYRREATEGRPVRHFICHDDQEGPYIDTPVPSYPPSTTGDDESSWEELIVPIPNGIWMTGQSAESWAAIDVLETAEWAMTMLPGIADELQVDVAEHTRSLAQFIARAEARDIALRTYAIQSEVFKVNYAHRARADRAAIEAIRQVPLPRFIWVVELMDRTLRDAQIRGIVDPEYRGSVIGEIIYDATGYDLERQRKVVHLPGMMIMEHLRPKADAVRLCDTSLRYHTGRPSYLPAGPELFGQGKAAIAGRGFV